MAWNEPGGPDKDPWGGPGKEQGPPDLDEAFRKLQEKMGGLFGGKGGRRAGKGGGPGALMIIGLLAVVWFLSGWYIVDEGKRGVVLQFGAYKEATMPGPHWYPRFVQTVEIVEMDVIRSVELGMRTEDALMLTQDENIIDIKYAVQYKVKEPRAYLFNVRHPDETLREATESAVREIVGKREMDFVITGGRSQVADEAQRLAQDILDRYDTGLVITSLNMQDAQPPEQVQGAFADAVKAREDKERLRNEAEAYANDVLPKARGQAARMIEEANAYKAQVASAAQGEAERFLQVLSEYRKAPGVTRKRLYMDSIESVLSKSSKVVVDTEGSNNLLYLPLESLMKRSGPIPQAERLNQLLEPESTTVTNSTRGIEARPRPTLRQREVR